MNIAKISQEIKHVASDHTHLSEKFLILGPPLEIPSYATGNHVKVSTSLGLLLARLGFLGRPVDLLPQEW